MTIDGIHYGAIEAALERVQGSNLWLTFAIREGKNREVRNVLEHLGLTVARLIRVSFGPFQLGELAEGAVEEVPHAHAARATRRTRGRALASADFSGPVAAPPAAPVLTIRQKRKKFARDRAAKSDSKANRRSAFLARARTGTSGKKAAAKIPRRAPR